jgi:hypothetical protein
VTPLGCPTSRHRPNRRSDTTPTVTPDRVDTGTRPSPQCRPRRRVVGVTFPLATMQTTVAAPALVAPVPPKRPTRYDFCSSENWRRTRNAW